MNKSILLILLFNLLYLDVSSQTAFVEELGKIYEPTWDFIRIEPSGRLSYIHEKSIFTSEDEGQSWFETVTPFTLYNYTNNSQTGYKALNNGNYLLHNGSTMHYKENNEWKLFEINGDSTFKYGPYIVGEKVLIINANNLYSYNDNTKEIKLELELEDFSTRRIYPFKNHLIIYTAYREYSVYTKDLTYITTLNYQPAHITEEGYFLRYWEPWYGNGIWGSNLSISYDFGETYTLLFESEQQEIGILGDIAGRIYVRGFISQPEAWSNGHFQALTGYIEIETGEFVSVQDGVSGNYYYKKHVINDHFYHNINGAIIKYIDGDLTKRKVIQGNNDVPVNIKKLRRSTDGILYAMTNNFLYRSLDDGNSWHNLLDYFNVVDFDLDSENNLYCISSDRILKSQDRGESFVEFSQEYAKGFIDNPNKILCFDNKKIIVQGIGHDHPEPFDLGCVDCWAPYPRSIFRSNNDGENWELSHVIEGYGVFSEEFYDYPNDDSFNTEYIVKLDNQILSVYNNYFSSTEKEDFTKKITSLPNEWINNYPYPYSYTIDYGLNRNGDLLKIEEEFLSYSIDCGASYLPLTETRSGAIHGGAKKESIFVISNDLENDQNILSHMRNLSTAVVDLEVVRDEDHTIVVNDKFDNFYTDGVEEFLFSGSNTYKITNICYPEITFNYGESLAICAGESILLQSNIFADEYNWLFNGNPLNINLSTIEISEPGTYSLTTYSSYCVAQSANFQLILEEGPPVIFTQDGEPIICEGETYTIAVEDGADKYEWFKDTELLEGVDGNELTVDAEGTYIVKVYNEGCISTSETVVLLVNAIPQPSLNISAEDFICEGETLLIEVSEADSYEWFFNMESIGNNEPTFEASEPGIYQVLVTSNGCSALSEEVNLMFGEAPVLSTNDASISNHCVGDEIFLEVTSDAEIFSWIFNGEEIGNQAILEVTVTGIYQAIAYLGTCASEPLSFEVNIFDIPDVNLNLTGEQNICEGDSLVLKATDIYDSYQWYKNGDLLTEPSNELVVSTAGNYSVHGTLNDCIGESTQTMVNVNVKPDVSLNFTGEQTICKGDSMTLIANEVYDSYYWYRNNELLLEQSNQLVVSDAGTYYLQVMQGGCLGESVQTIINIIEVPIPTIISDALEICPGDLTNLHVELTGDIYYTWFVNGTELTDSNSSSIDTNLPGIYTVEIQLNGCPRISDPIEVTEFEIFPPTIEQIANILNSSEASSYQWYLDGLAIDGANGQGHTAIVSGGYYVVVIDANGCESQSELIDFVISSLTNHVSIEGLKMYPNPVVDLLTIEYDNTKGSIANLKVFNELGINIASIENQTHSTKVVADLNPYPDGIYFLEVILASGARSTFKCVKSK